MSTVSTAMQSKMIYGTHLTGKPNSTAFSSPPTSKLSCPRGQKRWVGERNKYDHMNFNIKRSLSLSGFPVVTVRRDYTSRNVSLSQVGSPVILIEFTETLMFFFGQLGKIPGPPV